MLRSSLKVNASIQFTLPGMIFLIFVAGAYLLVLNRAMVSGYSHDENQFIASAYLLATERLLPYVDYPYFHMPNLVFVYAILFKFTSYKLLAARYFSTLSATLMLAVTFWVTYGLFKKQSMASRLLVAVCAALLLLSNPLFKTASGKAWNHDFSILAALLATIIFVGGLGGRKAPGWLFLSGALLGLAIGVRVIWAVVIPPFLFAIFFSPAMKHSVRNFFL